MEATLDTIAATLGKLLDRSQAPPQRFLRVSQAAEYAGVAVKTIRRLLATGRLHTYRPVRGRVVIDRQELDQLILTSANARPRRRKATSGRESV